MACRGVIDLVRYVYHGEYTPAAAAEGGEPLDPLRQTVVHFVVLYLNIFSDFAEHKQLLRQGGDYVVDLQRTIMTWLL